MMALWMLYSTFIAAVLGVAAAIFERASGETRARRWFWVGALLVGVALPVWVAMRSALPDTPVSVLGGGLTSKIAAPMSISTALSARIGELLASAKTESLSRFDTPFAVLWAGVAFLAVGIYGVATWSLARRRREWRAVTIDGQRVLVADAVGPAVVGTLQPEIVVPEWSLGLPHRERALMIEHERQHVRARDPLVLHAAAFVALLMPWNVAVWWLNRRLRLAVELDCDARVLSLGHDVRSYGSLLLNVCSRRQRVGAMLAPALFERTSSLTKRVLAMTPQPSRFRRSRLAFGSMVAAALVFLACEMPTPEMLAPDGKNADAKRLFGKVEATERVVGRQDLKKLVAENFAAIARGDGGPSILFVVRSDKGDIVMTESQPAENARMPIARDEPRGQLRDSEKESVELKIAQQQAPGVIVRAPQGTVGLKVRSADRRLALPGGIAALGASDIASIDVSKHAGGVVAPNAVSIITIVLKPGAKVPQ